MLGCRIIDGLIETGSLMAVCCGCGARCYWAGTDIGITAFASDKVGRRALARRTVP